MAEITLEIAAYERMQSDLEREHLGKWVVVHDEELIGAYDDFEDAACAGVQRFGIGPFLLRQVGAKPLNPWTPAIYQESGPIHLMHQVFSRTPPPD